ncbi:hypothetical protein [Cytobacillus oceanisediminis]|uniref:hypothetical protein n=1 Tax=Cytobacillus oceanisediminis TaxID=665099 RepID=UPI00254A7260|nr:hypothetical protein [Cytobacillus oceanisediminis]MDK7669285.1 hypothetical protein [Cytobacillus oceanisediminis]
MITSRNLYVNGDDDYKNTPTKIEMPQVMQEAVPVTIRKNVETSFGSIHKTVKFEAVTDAGEVIRAESIRIDSWQSPTSPQVMKKLSEFSECLKNEGYQI